MALLSKSLAAFTEDLRSRWGVPGVSVSLLDGRSQGFGHPTSGPMTPDSITLMASNTKLFTAVAIGILVDQGKLTFESKIKDLIPGFKLDNEHTMEHVTISDALSHSTGCASGNMTYPFVYNDCNKDIVHQICDSRCHQELREDFVYDNRWFSLAAYIIEELSGQTFSSFMQDHILKPLGMHHSTFSSKEAELPVINPSITLDDGKSMQDLPFWCYRVQPGNSLESAGGLFSTASDMIKWIGYLSRTVKGENEPMEPSIISRVSLKEVIRPRIISRMQMWFADLDRGEAAHPGFSAPLYALGVERHHLYGIDIATHNGASLGYSSVTLWTPDRDFGIVVLANQQHRGNAVINLIALRAFEEHFGIKHANWEARTMDHPKMWSTNPFKPPRLLSQRNSVTKLLDLRGTYSAKGCKNIHIVGVDDTEGVPARVLELRDHFLNSKAKVFGIFAGEIKMVAIWDTMDSYGKDLASLHHVGDNVFYGEWLQFYRARGNFEAVLTPASVTWNAAGPLFYAYVNSEGVLQLEFLHTWGKEVPEVALEEGDFTFTRIETFLNLDMVPFMAV